MKKLLITLVSLTLWISSVAQSVDSTKLLTKKFLNERFPTTRDFDIQYEQLGSRNFHSRLYNEDFQQGKIKSERKFKFAANIPIYKQPKFIISGSFRYMDDTFDLTSLNVVNPNLASFPKGNHPEFQYFSTAANFTYFSKLFNRSLVFNSSLVADGNDKGFQRITGFASAALVLKKTPETTISAGLIGLIDKSSIFPVLPVFSLQHKFDNNRLSLDLVLPQRVMMKTSLYKGSQLSLGTEFGSDLIYVNPIRPILPGTYLYDQLELKSGAIFDQKIGDHLIVSFRGGLENILNAKLFPKDKGQSAYVYRGYPGSTSYFNVGISFNPFKKQ